MQTFLRAIQNRAFKICHCAFSNQRSDGFGLSWLAEQRLNHGPLRGLLSSSHGQAGDVCSLHMDGRCYVAPPRLRGTGSLVILHESAIPEWDPQWSGPDLASQMRCWRLPWTPARATCRTKGRAFVHGLCGYHAARSELRHSGWPEIKLADLKHAVSRAKSRSGFDRK